MVDKVRVGIVGTGIISLLHGKAYPRHPNAEIVAVCDNRKEAARERAQQWGVKKIYTDYKQLLKDEEVDAIEILTPHFLHKEIAVAAAEAGKHINVQKPMAVNVKEADEMIRAARKAGVILQAQENYVFFAPIMKAKELIEEGKIGEPVRFRMEQAGGSPIQILPYIKELASKSFEKIPPYFLANMSPFTKRFFENIDRAYAEGWRYDPKRSGGGNMLDHGHHMASVAHWLMGNFKRVYAWIDFSTFGEAPATIMWTYEDQQKHGTWEISQTDIPVFAKYYGGYETYQVIGNKGIIWVTCATERLRNIPPVIMYEGGKTTSFEAVESDWGESFVLAVHHFIDCILEDKQPKFTGEDGKRSIQFILAAYKSAQEGREVDVKEIT